MGSRLYIYRTLCEKILFSFVVIPALLFSSSGFASDCSVVFGKAAPRSVDYYLNSLKKNPEKDPRFLDPTKEAELVPAWEGTRKVPKAIADTLHPKTSLLDFQLLAADGGSVKIAQPGNFLSMRLNHSWNGKNMSTNLGLSVDAIFKKSLDKSEYLVPNNARAVYIFMHGGGTKTTGHHVAASLSNALAQHGIVVLSIDAPYHAYGPRVQNLKPLEYYEYLRDFRHEFIPKDVPTFIGGHSMGGLHADNIMRLSDKKNLGFDKAFRGLINLSGPLDNAPGKSLKEKYAAEDVINRNEELMSLVPKAERDLNVLLLTQGKSSALSGLSTETFMGLVNWTKPKHNGRQYIPTLAIMGERDALYVGREKIFKKYITDLENTEAHVLGQRKNFKDQDIWVSHMIFDHYIPGTKTPESHHLIKNFIEKHTESRQPEGESQALVSAKNSSHGLLLQVVKEYYINLAFRQFAQRYVYFQKKPTEKMIATNKEIGQLVKETKELEKLIKEKSKAGLTEEAKSLQEKKNQIQSKINKRGDLQQSRFIPEGELAAFAKANIQRRNEINAAKKEGVVKRKALNKEIQRLNDEKAKLQGKYEKALSEFIEQQAATNPQWAQARTEVQQKLKEMVELQIEMNEQNHQLALKNIENGSFAINPSPALVEVYKKLDAAYARYNKAVAKERQLIEEAGARGELGPELKELFNKLYGSIKDFQQNSFSPESLYGRAKAAKDQLEALRLEDSNLSKEYNDLLKGYVSRITPELYTFQEVTLEQALNRSLLEVEGNSPKDIENLWGIWTGLWKERPMDEGTSLY